MIPVAIVGVFFKDYVEALFGSGLLVVGVALLITACLLAFAYYALSPFKDGYIFSGCFYHRSGSGLCRIAWFVPFRFHHRYGDSAGE